VAFHCIGIHSLFNHSPLKDIRFVSSFFFSITDKAAVDKCVHICVDKFFISLGKIPGSTIGVLYVKYIYSIFSENAKLFFKVAVPFYIPASAV
jgi:hypothetical protein